MCTPKIVNAVVALITLSFGLMSPLIPTFISIQLFHFFNFNLSYVQNVPTI